jgi:hypothetical protein
MPPLIIPTGRDVSHATHRTDTEWRLKLWLLASLWHSAFGDIAVASLRTFIELVTEEWARRVAGGN